MLEITSSETGDTVTALALNLEEDNIGAVIMGEWTTLHEGDQVRRTGRVLDVSVGSDIRHLPVLRRGKLVGMLSDRDLRRGLAKLRRRDEAFDMARSPEIPELRARDLMASPVLTVGPDCPLRSAASAMAEEQIGALPVVEDGRLVGILTQTDLLRDYAELPLQAA